MAALTERAEVRQPVGRVAIEMCRCKDYASHPELSGFHKVGPPGHALVGRLEFLAHGAAEGGVTASSAALNRLAPRNNASRNTHARAAGISSEKLTSGRTAC
jgi:hypothetical protein